MDPASLMASLISLSVFIGFGWKASQRLSELQADIDKRIDGLTDKLYHRDLVHQTSEQKFEAEIKLLGYQINKLEIATSKKFTAMKSGIMDLERYLSAREGSSFKIRVSDLTDTGDDGDGTR